MSPSKRFVREDGWALPLMMAVLGVSGVLAGVAVSGAVNLNDSANDDRRAKRALAAAEAGLQAASYRLAQLRPNTAHCMLTNTSQAPNGGGECPATPAESAGDGATFTYTVTPALAPGATCADLPTIGATPPTSTDHCVTAVGTVGRIQRRVQSRVRILRATIFNLIGLVGLDFVTLRNSDVITSDMGSNGQITGTNSVEVGGEIKIPIGAPDPVINGSNPPVERLPAPWALDEVDYAASAAANDNGNLPGGAPANRELALGNSAEITLQSGTYNLCELYAENSVKIHINGLVRIYIDSPDRPGSGCLAGTGRFCLDNSVLFGENLKRADLLEIYVYGAPDNHCVSGRPGRPFTGTAAVQGVVADSDVVFANSIKFWGTVYAPRSRFVGMNSIEFEGGVASKSIDFANSTKFFYPSSVRDKVPAPGPVRRLSWTECRSVPTNAADPESGCT